MQTAAVGAAQVGAAQVGAAQVGAATVRATSVRAAAGALTADAASAGADKLVRWRPIDTSWPNSFSSPLSSLPSLIADREWT